MPRAQKSTGRRGWRAWFDASPEYKGLGRRIEQLLRLAEEQANDVLASAQRDADQIRAAARADAGAIRAAAVHPER